MDYPSDHLETAGIYIGTNEAGLVLKFTLDDSETLRFYVRGCDFLNLGHLRECLFLQVFIDVVDYRDRVAKMKMDIAAQRGANTIAFVRIIIKTIEMFIFLLFFRSFIINFNIRIVKFVALDLCSSGSKDTIFE